MMCFPQQMQTHMHHVVGRLKKRWMAAVACVLCNCCCRSAVNVEPTRTESANEGPSCYAACDPFDVCLMRCANRDNVYHVGESSL